MTHDEVDKMMDDAFAGARPDAAFEDRLVAGLRADDARRIRLPHVHPMVRRAAVGVAAAILLGGVGFVVTNEPIVDRYAARIISASNLRQIGQAQQLYANENRGAFPRAGATELGWFDSPREIARQTVRRLRENSGDRIMPGLQLAEDDLASQQGGDDHVSGLALGRKPELRTEAEARFHAGYEFDASGTGAVADTKNGRTGVGEGKDIGAPRDQYDSVMDPMKDDPVSGVAPLAKVPDADGDGIQQTGRSTVTYGNSSFWQPRPGNAPNFSLDQTEGLQRGGGRSDRAALAPFGAPGAKPGQQQQGQQTSDDLAAGTENAEIQNDIRRSQREAVAQREATITDLERTAKRLTDENRHEEARGVVAQIAVLDPKNQYALGQAPANTNGGAAPAAQNPPRPDPAATQAARKVIRNGEMTFEVDGYDSSVLQITKIAAEEGGFVATTESEKLPNGKVKGSVVVRVPPERLDTLVLKLRGLGDLKSSRVAAQDITKQYTDLDAQLRAAKAMEERLIEIVKSGKGEIKDLLAAEKQLGTWREKIERLEGEIRYYNNLISLSTLTVTLAERDIRTAGLLTESEGVNMGIEAEDVEAARAAAIKAIDDAKGRVVESDLKKHDAGQFAATITADVAPDKAGAVIDRLKQLGRVARLEVQRRQATAEGAGSPAPGARVERKDTRLVLSIYNLANVQARRTTTLQLAADDVEKAYRAILAQVESAGGRVLKSQLTRPTPDQTAGEIAFEAPAAAADVLLDAVRASGEVMRLDTSTNPDTQDVTDAKRGFSVRVQSVTGVPAREQVRLQLAVDDVAAKYEKLLDALRSAGARVVSSQINQQDPNKTTASLEVDARRAQRPAVERALAEAGGVYGRAVTHAAEGQPALEDKVRLSVTMNDVDHLAPRESTTIGVETDDVAKAVGAVEATALALGGRKVDSDWAQQPGGQTVAKVVVDVPLAKAPELLAKARDQGRVLTVQRDQSPGAPEGPFARARLTMTVATADPIVQRDQSFAHSIRSGLATSVEWLLRSVTLIVIGLCLVAPWALIVWVVWKVVRRRRDRRDTAPPDVPGAAPPATA